MRYFILGLVLILSGCSVSVEKSSEPKLVYVTTPLMLPARPEIPKLSSNELDCIDDSSQEKLLQRDAAMKTYIKQLETIILSTHKK